MSATKPGFTHIWAWREETGDVYTGEWAPEGDNIAPIEAASFVDAELSHAMVAAVLGEAAEIAIRHKSKVEINEPLWHEGQDWAAFRIQQAILDAITPDAQAALDRAIAKARADAWSDFNEGASEVDRLRLVAFSSNSAKDKSAYLEACAKWFNGRHTRAIKEPRP